MQNGALLISLKFRENIVHTSHSHAPTDTDYDVVSSTEIKKNMHGRLIIAKSSYTIALRT